VHCEARDDAVTLRIEPSTLEALAERAAWRYPPPYDFYDDDGVPPKNPECFYSVRDQDGALVGFYFFMPRGDALFYGLGLHPDLTGRGLGLDFVEAGIAFAEERFGSRRLVLDVAEFNARAIRVYERAGFHRTGSHFRGDVLFVDMERPA
jgi:[ribosomal protein S18]-alanine N-acetyltransferase